MVQPSRWTFRAGLGVALGVVAAARLAVSEGAPARAGEPRKTPRAPARSKALTAIVLSISVGSPFYLSLVGGSGVPPTHGQSLEDGIEPGLRDDLEEA